jgi:DnaK suppressor protein
LNTTPFRTALQTLQQEILGKYRLLREEIKSGDDVADVEEQCVNEFTSSLSGRLLESDGQRLAQIAAALKRIEVGAYGICQECDTPIGTARLKAMPEAEYCVWCRSTTSSPPLMTRSLVPPSCPATSPSGSAPSIVHREFPTPRASLPGRFYAIRRTIQLIAKIQKPIADPKMATQNQMNFFSSSESGMQKA